MIACGGGGGGSGGSQDGSVGDGGSGNDNSDGGGSDDDSSDSGDDGSSDDDGSSGDNGAGDGDTSQDPTDANYGLDGRFYGGNSEFLDLATGKEYVIAPQFGDSTTYPSKDGSEFVEVMDHHRFIWDDEECYGFAIWKQLIAIRDAQTGLINDSFELFEQVYGEARLSPDNQFVAVFWDDDKGCPEGTSSQLSIFSRQGELIIKAVESISSYDWLPDNRLVISDGDSIMVEDTPFTLEVMSYPLPETLTGKAVNLKASPDGSRVLFEVVTDASSWLSTVSFREATVWEFNLDTLQFSEYVTSRRENEEPQINTPVWSPDGNQIIITEDYTGGVASSITPGDFFTGWDGWKELIIVPLEVSGVNYVSDATEPSMLLPPAGDSSARPIFTYKDNAEYLMRMSPFEQQAWVPAPAAKMPSAGSLPVENSAPILGIVAKLFFADEGDSDNFVLKELDLASNTTSEIFEISVDHTDEYYWRIYPSADGEYFAYYDYRDSDDKVIVIFNRQGNVLTEIQLFQDDSYDLSASSRVMFSPDNSLLAFAYEDDNNDDRESVLVIDWQSDGYSRVFDEQEFDDVEWMPNGDLLLFAESEVYLSAFSGGTLGDPTHLFSLNGNNPRHPDASPDGDKIAFTLGRHIWTVNIDGSELRQLTAMSDRFESYPVWSLDGKYLVVQSHDEDQDFGDYFIIAADAEVVPLWQDGEIPQAHRLTPLARTYGPAYWQ